MNVDTETTGRPRRWGRVVDVVEGGVLYIEDAERLVVAGVDWPTDETQRSALENQLSELVGDKIVYYDVTGADELGRLLAEVWVEDRSVNKTLRSHS